MTSDDRAVNTLPCPHVDHESGAACGGTMQLEAGSETAFMLRCHDCGEYFYAANRGLSAIRCCLPTDYDAALALVLPQSPTEAKAHEQRLNEVQQRARDLERRAFEGLT